MSKEKNDIEIFEGKSFSDLTKDIYDNQQNKKLQLDLLIQEIHGMIQTLDDAVLVAPLIREFFEVAVKNDEHLVKLAGVLQRIMSKSQGESDESMLLSEAEKEELLNNLQDITNQIETDVNKKKVDELKEKKDNKWVSN
tara:strand:+ start:760 stop:1176 length:417 start_codon:yes stop_codon:yes gene_type:complete